MLQFLADYALGIDRRLFVVRTGQRGVPLSPPFDNPLSMGTAYAWARSLWA